MNYNFDKPVDRTGTNSVKWDRYAGQDIIPMWIADMDFEVPNVIVEALNKVTDHGVLGYSNIPPALTAVMVNRLRTLHEWEVQPEWLIWLPGLVPGLTLSVLTAVSEEEEVMITSPVYGPFGLVPEGLGRSVIKVPLLLQDERWTLDFDAIEQAITPKTKLFILCNPYNPAGTVFTISELEQLAKICERHGIIICSDEIHCDLILESDKKHVSIASLSEQVAQHSITLLAPSKTFNIAGLGCSLAVIPNSELRGKFEKLRRFMLPGVSAYAAEAALAAYRDGGDWHAELLRYLKRNFDYLYTELNQIPGIRVFHQEATYLAWLDVSELKLANPLEVFEAIGVGVQDGANFFAPPGYVRLNFGTQFDVVKQAVARIKERFNS